MTKKELKTTIRQICTAVGVGVRFCELKHGTDGLCDCEKQKITINSKNTKKGMLTATFHELGHIYCVRKGIYKEFHYTDKKHTPNQVFRIENGVEKIAKKLWDTAGMRKKFGQYIYYYTKDRKPEIIDWIILTGYK